jgi:hypothetical protein
MSSAKANYATVPNTPITQAQLFGDANADAPHGEFTTFPPNFDAGGWHVHTNTREPRGAEGRVHLPRRAWREACGSR